jgi:SAM-dependent methyltransferase
MTEAQERRYDERAADYARYWAPVIGPTAVRVLDLADTSINAANAGVRVLDVGTGTGTLARAAVRRWSHARVTGIDVSSGMLGVAERTADEELDAAARSRLDFTTASADRLPFPDASFDVAISSFVLQLVPNRARALREIRRVLVPGGLLGWVTWEAGRAGRPYAPDVAFDEALDLIGFGARDEGDGRSGDIPSPEAAVSQLRRAGFGDVTARREWLEHPWDRTSYLEFMTEYDELDLIEDMSTRERRRFLDEVGTRLDRLRPDEFVWRAPVVFAAGRRSGRG